MIAVTSSILSRISMLALVSVLALAICTSEARANKHALLVYDADSGRVLQQENGYESRYPASLTKMMTLYLLFEQLRSGVVTLDTKMKVSAHAAAQPQTNISLRVGDTLTVRQAISALVIRSANDVAVVVAEHLGSSQAAFATMMTNKSRALGMKNTVFKNPHGLPDSRQVTTAYDMALLGVALRRDFPQYYHYSNARSFSYKGRVYTSHNRVLDRLPGVDGIKTGYINASGFNLVSSLKRNGVNVVAVVMGGTSGAQRDNRMVSLLGGTYQTMLAKRGGSESAVAVAHAPLPVKKPLLAATPSKLDELVSDVVRQAGTQPKTEPVKLAAAVPEVKSPALTQQSAATSGRNNNVRIVRDQMYRPADVETRSPSIKVSFKENAPRQVSDNSLKVNLSLDSSASAGKSAALPPPQTLDYQLATLNHHISAPSAVASQSQSSPGKDWAVQVGIFRDTASARKALKEVARSVHNAAQGAVAHVEYAQEDSRSFHRARLKNLSHSEATTVCRKLQQMSRDCFVTRVSSL